MSVIKCIQLNNSVAMPLLGLGTFKIRGQETVHRILDSALAAGYRSFDTASVYRNEEDIGRSLQTLLPKYGLCRQDIFITSKLAPKDQGRGACREACLLSLARLQCSYLDLFLIHWPGTQKMQPGDSRHKPNRLGSWADMEQLYEEGKLRAVGVSNFLQHHLEELTGVCRVTPAVLQLLYDSTVQMIASQYNKTPAQILLRWAVQQGVGVLPKSTNKKHIEENAQVFDFELKEHDMQTLSGLSSNVHYCWDPSLIT
ncbi:9,11-endoperoxide prostaglandin H2 reductase-like isoform X2 [Babylonia areolata]|uniref:9,11-endoperoxide prostaglandin H2 reductase-like isoform X2 n=1 Tax=Babylonia areolata TaxID=304850 RepID=UPI003FD206A1